MAAKIAPPKESDVPLISTTNSASSGHAVASINVMQVEQAIVNLREEMRSPQPSGVAPGKSPPQPQTTLTNEGIQNQISPTEKLDEGDLDEKKPEIQSVALVEKPETIEEMKFVPLVTQEKEAEVSEEMHLVPQEEKETEAPEVMQPDALQEKEVEVSDEMQLEEVEVSEVMQLAPQEEKEVDFSEEMQPEALEIKWGAVVEKNQEVGAVVEES